jgi:hypothetical protein
LRANDISMAFQQHFIGYCDGISMAIAMAIEIIFGFIMMVAITKLYLVRLVHCNGQSSFLT